MARFDINVVDNEISIVADNLTQSARNDAVTAAADALEAAVSAAASAGVALAAAGPFYTSPSAGVDPVTGVPSGDEFNVESSPTAPTFDVYRNDSGTAVLVRDGIIRDPSAPGTAGFIGHLETTVAAALPVIPQAYGAAGNGTTNDSTAFSDARVARSNISGGPNGNYSIRDIALADHDSYFGNNSLLNAASGATNLFTIGGFNSRVKDVYVSSSANCSGAAFRIVASRFPFLTDVVGVNLEDGVLQIEPITPASQAIAKPLISNIWGEGITGTGFLMGSSVSEMHMTNVHLYGKTQASTGGARPSFTSIGWRQNTPQVGAAVGGHLVTNANMIAFGIGWHLTDAQLSSYVNCISDSCSDYGVLIDGASNNIKFADLFVGTTRGIKVAGSAQVWFDGLVTKFNGLIPPWGSTDFYNGVTSFYDMEVQETAKVRVSNWRGDKRIFVAPTASLTIDDGIRFQFRTTGTIAAGSTVFMAETGSTATEAEAIWRAPCDGHIVGFFVGTTVAPGAGQTYTYTMRRNTSTPSPTISAVATGTTAFNTEAWCGLNPLRVLKGENFALRLETSAGAAAARHNGSILFLPE